jgi:hypothetical protein
MQYQVIPSNFFAELKLWSIYRGAINYTIGARLVQITIDSSPCISFGICSELRRKQCRLALAAAASRSAEKYCHIRFFYASLNMKRDQRRFL